MLHEYVAEKLLELESERLDRALTVQRELLDRDGQARSRPFIGPVLRAAGRTLRRAGEGLEDWASPADCDKRLRAEQRSG